MLRLFGAKVKSAIEHQYEGATNEWNPLPEKLVFAPLALVNDVDLAS
jgi:hypothetical protein